MFRIIFTSDCKNSNINSSKLFKWIGFQYLDTFPAYWAGSISVDATITKIMEPSWQFMVYDDSELDDVLDHIREHKLPEYTIRIILQDGTIIE